MNSMAEKYIRKEALPFIFCPGCGHGIVVNSFIRAVDKLGVKQNEMACVSGIGCSSWSPVYLNFDCLHTIHGRALAHAEGLKAVNPDKTIVVFSGDGDCAGIGGNHLIHAAKRNVDITVIMMSNYIYGMTGGQRAPTTPFGAITKTSPLGNEEHPFDMYALLRGAGATFYARCSATHPMQLEKSIEAAILHKGFSFIEVLSPCPTTAGRNIFNFKTPAEMFDWYESQVYVLKNGETPDAESEKIALGVLYVDNKKEELCDVQAEKKEAAKR
ncbi:MAG: thiamine pyrophosphate-dependent enzyme [Oscillospiraceae bacterium]